PTLILGLAIPGSHKFFDPDLNGLLLASINFVHLRLIHLLTGKVGSGDNFIINRHTFEKINRLLGSGEPGWEIEATVFKSVFVVHKDIRLCFATLLLLVATQMVPI